VQLVDRLVEAGLARRAPSRTDRRSVLVKLTANGEALLDTLAGQHLQELLRQEPLLSKSLRRLRAARR
jgi:DNA-binding MarR family transcriptional regulator